MGSAPYQFDLHNSKSIDGGTACPLALYVHFGILEFLLTMSNPLIPIFNKNCVIAFVHELSMSSCRAFKPSPIH